MTEYTIFYTLFVPSSNADKAYSQQARDVVADSVVMPAKFVLIDTTHDRVLSLIVTGPFSGMSHLALARRSETMREGRFFGAGKIQNIGNDRVAAKWDSDTCKHKDAYGYDTPQGLEQEELAAILELVKIKAVECLEGVIRGDQTS